eukprot:scaffold2044_cov247-Pinguiococcus_pyrenoidosus.AAC.10
MRGRPVRRAEERWTPPRQPKRGWGLSPATGTPTKPGQHPKEGLPHGTYHLQRANSSGTKNPQSFRLSMKTPMGRSDPPGKQRPQYPQSVSGRPSHPLRERNREEAKSRTRLCPERQYEGPKERTNVHEPPEIDKEGKCIHQHSPTPEALPWGLRCST